MQKYRPDIDGLRAVAVLSVVFYHLVLLIHGGFAGVDVFFTISGFLIGSIILSETAAGTFSFAGFYARRIRRIVPALFVMMLGCAVVAYRVLLPSELEGFAKSMAAAGFSFSNFYFWSQSEYFGQVWRSTPLVHTWSLGVEEQFYLLLPIVLVLLRRFFPRRFDLGIYAIAAVSFGLSIYVTLRYPSAAYYLPHTRAWELLLGVMLALDGFPRIHRPFMRHTAGIAGAVLIFAAVWFFRPWTPYPGVAALAPCAGAALIIAAGRTGPNLVGRILSIGPINFIGRISYSLYLWHWPVIACAAYGVTLMKGLGRHQNQALLFGVSMVLAVISWRFVEMPFRSGFLSAGLHKTFAGATAAVILVAILAVGAVVSQGAPWRFSPPEVELARYIYFDPDSKEDVFRNGVCFVNKPSEFSAAKCLPEKPGQKKLLVMGDSHAAAMWSGLDRVLEGVNVMQVTAPRCIPVLHQPPRQEADCAKLMEYALTSYLMSHQVDVVMLQAFWYAEFLPAIGETVVWLREHNIPVILVGPIPVYDSQLPRLLAFSIRQKDPLMPRAHLVRTIQPLDQQMAALARDTWHVPYVSLVDLLCKEGSCIEYAAPGVPFLSDADHMTKAGSILTAQRMLALGILPVANASLLEEHRRQARR